MSSTHHEIDESLLSHVPADIHVCIEPNVVAGGSITQGLSCACGCCRSSLRP